MALFTGAGFATYFTPSGTRKGCRNANMGVVFSGRAFYLKNAEKQRVSSRKISKKGLFT